MTERVGIQSYPLSWPHGWERTKPADQRQSKFGRAYRSSLTVYSASQDVLAELSRLGAIRPVISSNLRVRGDGIPYSGQREPDDAGVAVWFELPDDHGSLRQQVLACDRWWRVQENLRAIAKHIEALRGMDRWGVGSVYQAFSGYQALPERADGFPWWQVLGVAPNASREEIDRAYKARARERHPDVTGGVREGWDQLQRARAQALAQCP